MIKLKWIYLNYWLFNDCKGLTQHFCFVFLPNQNGITANQKKIEKKKKYSKLNKTIVVVIVWNSSRLKISPRILFNIYKIVGQTNRILCKSKRASICLPFLVEWKLIIWFINGSPINSHSFNEHKCYIRWTKTRKRKWNNNKKTHETREK